MARNRSLQTFAWLVLAILLLANGISSRQRELQKEETYGLIDTQNMIIQDHVRILQGEIYDLEYQVSPIQPVLSLISAVYWIVLALQLATAVFIALRASDKIFWTSYASIHIQLLYLLGTVLQKNTGLIHTMTTFSTYQSSLYFGYSDLNIDLDSAKRLDYINHNITMLKQSFVSPFILNHRLIPVLVYLITWILTPAPVVGEFFFRLRIYCYLSYVVQFVYYSLTTFIAISQQKLGISTSYTFLNAILAFFVLVLVLLDTMWLLKTREPKVREMRNKRKVFFDVTKTQILFGGSGYLNSLIRACDLWYAIIMALVFAAFGEVKGANVVILLIVLVIHAVCLVINLERQSTLKDKRYELPIIFRMFAQSCYCMLILALLVYNFRINYLSPKSSKTMSIGFLLLWILDVICIFLVVLLRLCIPSEPKISKYLITKDYEFNNRLTICDSQNEMSSMHSVRKVAPVAIVPLAPIDSNDLVESKDNNNVHQPKDMDESELRKHRQDRSDFQNTQIYRVVLPQNSISKVTNLQPESQQDFDYSHVPKTPDEQGVH